MKKVFAILCIGLGIYEAIALVNDDEGDTISEITWHLSRRPLIPFLIGVVCGHFFWQKVDTVKVELPKESTATVEVTST